MLRRQNNEENNENFDAGLVKSMHPQRKVTSPFNPTPHPNHVSTWIGFNAAQVNGDGVTLTYCLFMACEIAKYMNIMKTFFAIHEAHAR